MNAIRTNRALRIVAVVATFIGWFVLSNHCALGGIAVRAAAQKAHACCQNGTSQPLKEPAGGKPSMECCKSLHAVVPDGAKLTDLSPPFVIGAFVAWILIHDTQVDAALLAFDDTGPPRAESFSELVLHRSLRSHAPPFSS